MAVSVLYAQMNVGLQHYKDRPILDGTDTEYNIDIALTILTDFQRAW